MERKMIKHSDSRFPAFTSPSRGSESSTLSWVAKRLGRLIVPPSRRPNPLSRLDFYKVGHGLTYRLRLYTGKDRVDIWRGYTWGTLRYWQLLLDHELEELVEWDEEVSVEDVAYAYALDR